MNKADLVNLVAARTELTKTDVSMVVDAAIETIIDSVVEGKKVSILGFGSFEPRERSARQGLNPKTGEKIAIPAKRVPAFTVEGGELTDTAKVLLWRPCSGKWGTFMAPMFRQVAMRMS